MMPVKVYVNTSFLIIIQNLYFFFVLYFFPKIFPSSALSLFYVLWNFQLIKTI